MVEANIEIVYAVLGIGAAGGVVILIVRAASQANDHRANKLEFQRQEEANRLNVERQEGLRLLAAQQRRELLLDRFADEQIVNGILAGEIWHDMTKERLVESWGVPQARDEKVLKTKVKETDIYGRTGVNRFAQKVFLENDVVVGWER